MSFSVEHDRRLLSACFSGNMEASETLVRRFSDPVYRSVQYTLTVKQVHFNKHDVEDLHNTVFLRLFEHGCKRLRQYRGKNGCSLASWIRMVTVRTVLDHLREKGLDAMVWQKRRVPFEQVIGLKSDEMEPWAAIEKAEQGRLLQDGIQRLPPRYQLFMKLHLDQGLPVAEVAEAMKLSIEHAYTMKHRAIQKLKSFMAESLQT